MGLGRLLAVVLAVLLSVAAAQAASFAAQYKLELFFGDLNDPFGDDVADAVGTVKVVTFDANFPDFSDEVVASIELGGVTYDYVDPVVFPLLLTKNGPKISDALLSGPYPLSPATVLSLFFGGSQLTPFFWTQRDCSTDGMGSFECIATGRLQGGYTLTEIPASIPLPASALLLPAALGALMAVRRRRR